MGGVATTQTDGYALGVTMLLTLTALPADSLLHRCRDMLMSPSDRAKWVHPAVADSRAGVWPANVACGIASLVEGLSWETHTERRLAVSRAHDALVSLAEKVGVDGVASCDDF
mmetsp:Transcript_6885/g.20649  ORF Transcript_6885/g.20649 Transcript_6885/m.20649 type:complete len:113 (-) Transcript_6885:223-561(-)